jgi:hypothetical protein
MEIDPEALSRRDLHRLPNGMVVPRPMSWVTSVSTGAGAIGELVAMNC